MHEVISFSAFLKFVNENYEDSAEFYKHPKQVFEKMSQVLESAMGGCSGAVKTCLKHSNF